MAGCLLRPGKVLDAQQRYIDHKADPKLWRLSNGASVFLDRQPEAITAPGCLELLVCSRFELRGRP